MLRETDTRIRIRIILNRALLQPRGNYAHHIESDLLGKSPSRRTVQPRSPFVRHCRVALTGLHFIPCLIEPDRAIEGFSRFEPLRSLGRSERFVALENQWFCFLESSLPGETLAKDASKQSPYRMTLRLR